MTESRLRQPRAPSRGPARSGASGGYGKVIITVLILGALAFVAWQLFPPYLHNYELNGYANDLVLDLVANRIKPGEIPTDITARAGELKLPVEMEDVTVNPGGSEASVHVNYTVVVDLKVYTWPIHFSVSASAPRLVY